MLLYQYLTDERITLVEMCVSHQTNVEGSRVHDKHPHTTQRHRSEKNIFKIC
jgi:hypothetical protein